MSRVILVCPSCGTVIKPSDEDAKNKHAEECGSRLQSTTIKKLNAQARRNPRTRPADAQRSSTPGEKIKVPQARRKRGPPQT